MYDNIGEFKNFTSHVTETLLVQLNDYDYLSLPQLQLDNFASLRLGVTFGKHG
jgi:hypothetical protein